MQSTYDEINLGIDLLRAQFQKLFFKRKAEKSTKYAKVVFRFNMSIYDAVRLLCWKVYARNKWYGMIFTHNIVQTR